MINEEEKQIFLENYSTTQIAIFLSHIYAIRDIALNYDCALILEDDAILDDKFMEIFKKYVENTPSDYDMLFIGNGCDLHIDNSIITPDCNIYIKDVISEYGTRCTDSYLVSKKCAQKIINYINNLTYKINESIDWWLNRVLREEHFIIYWAEPTIVKQGTQCGYYNSSY
jgi:GR25 family glycosyltransferase involved in LPS biosynthesis